MADLPDYYTQAQISEAEAASFKGGLFANRSLTPVSRDIYLATDTLQLFYCVADGAWVDVTHACLLLAGGAMTGEIAMGANKITGLADPTLAQDAATRAYVLARAALYLPLAGGTMAGNIIMGGNKLTGLGAGVVAGDSVRYEQLVQPTKEFFVPVTGIKTTATLGFHLSYAALRHDDAAEYYYAVFKCPHDFTALTHCKIICVPLTTGTIDWTVATNFAALDEAGNTHSDGDTADGLSMTNLIMEDIDISAAFTNLAADDYIGVLFTLDTLTTTTEVQVLGILFKYS